MRPLPCPRPLAALLAVATVLALAWMLALPALQGPDEGGHYSYTEKMVEQGTIVWTAVAGRPAGDQDRSTEHTIAAEWSGLEPLRANLAARPFGTELDERLWQRREAMLPAGARADADFTSTFRNPPLYYAYQAVPYSVGLLGGFFDRTFLMRLANLPLLLGAIVLTWLLAGRLLGPRVLPRTVATSFVALQPQMLQLTATINADIMLVLLSTAVLLLAVVVVQDGATKGRVLGLTALVAAAALAQPRGVALLVPVVIALALVVVRRRGIGRATVALGATGGLALTLAAVGVASAVGRGTPNQFVSYMWQFYLPRLDFMTPTIGPQDYGVREVLVERLWGAFAQLEIALPAGVADVVWGVTLAFTALLIALAIARRDRVRARGPEIAIALLALLALAVMLHVVAYRAMLDDPTDPVIAGRYILPLVALVGVGVALLVDAVPRALRPAAAGGAVAALVAVQFTGLGLTVERFYG
ncbi:MAG: DUF2142 domain-containing protein [Solirubrobacterales bacterium]|nr:DUF2142 domain-containing protein [Solirubrobacterales bacterium]